MARYLQRLYMLAGAILIATANGATANDFPNNTIRIISMHPAGSVTDVLARPLAQRLTASLKVPVIVENRPGANGIIATSYVAKTPPDGYTLLITSGAHIANAHIGKPLPYNPIADFAPIIQISNSYGLALITNLPANNMQELIALGKKKELTYAINGVGNVTHVAGLLLERMAGMKKMVPVPYNTPNLASDVMSGTVDLAFFSVAGSAPLAQAGRVKALAVTGPRRSPALPKSPTLEELGFKDFDVTGYFGVLAPAGTPRERVEIIYRESRKALESPELKNVIERGGQYVVGAGPDEFLAFLKKDDTYQKKLMSDLGLSGKQ